MKRRIKIRKNKYYSLKLITQTKKRTDIKNLFQLTKLQARVKAHLYLTPTDGNKKTLVHNHFVLSNK